ncbi:MAG: hypothetical protein CL912_27530 [Deltaproteobacteria bacterium]|nr:hypothetical protein [Deltaproteobacteria bacterium]
MVGRVRAIQLAGLLSCPLAPCAIEVSEASGPPETGHGDEGRILYPVGNIRKALSPCLSQITDSLSKSSQSITVDLSPPFAHDQHKTIQTSKKQESNKQERTGATSSPSSKINLFMPLYPSSTTQ